jgi:hypothetical protein
MMTIPLISQELDHLLAQYELDTNALATDDAKSQKKKALGDFIGSVFRSTAFLLVGVSCVESRAMTTVLVSIVLH